MLRLGFEEGEEEDALWSAAVVGGHRRRPYRLKCVGSQKGDNDIACENVYLK